MEEVVIAEAKNAITMRSGSSNYRTHYVEMSKVWISALA